MLIETALARHLMSNESVALLAGSRVYPVSIPQDQTLEAIAYQRTPDEGEYLAHDGAVGMEKARVQVTCQAQKYAEAKALAQAVRVALQGFRGLMGAEPGLTGSLAQTDLSTPGGGVWVAYCKVGADLDGGYGQEVRFSTVKLDIELLASTNL